MVPQSWHVWRRRSARRRASRFRQAPHIPTPGSGRPRRSRYRCGAVASAGADRADGGRVFADCSGSHRATRSPYQRVWIAKKRAIAYVFISRANKATRVGVCAWIPARVREGQSHPSGCSASAAGPDHGWSAHGRLLRYGGSAGEAEYRPVPRLRQPRVMAADARTPSKDSLVGIVDGAPHGCGGVVLEQVDQRRPRGRGRRTGGRAAAWRRRAGR